MCDSGDWTDAVPMKMQMSEPSGRTEAAES